MRMSKKRKKRFGVVLMILGLILVLAASSLTAYNIWDENRAYDVVAHVLEELDAFDKPDDPGALAPPDEMDVPDGSAPSEGEVTSDPETHMPICVLDSGTYIGVLEIPVLGLRLPVMQEWDYSKLKISPCRYTGSVYTNDMVVAAHSYRTHFGTLNQLHPGDDIWFIDMAGNRFHYQVAETESVMPTEIEHMITGDWDLTLFTCNYSGRARVTVRCNLN